MPRTVDRIRRTRLLPAVAGLVALDVVGGGIAVLTGQNTVRQAWGPDAVLAAPLPMIAVQAGLVAAADRDDDRRGAVAAGLLSAGLPGAPCSVLSGPEFSPPTSSERRRKVLGWR